jgi:hypothetical protein
LEKSRYIVKTIHRKRESPIPVPETPSAFHPPARTHVSNQDDDTVTPIRTAKVPSPSVRSGTFTAFKARPFFDDAFPATQSITAGHALRFSRILLSDNQHLS